LCSLSLSLSLRSWRFSSHFPPSILVATQAFSSSSSFTWYQWISDFSFRQNLDLFLRKFLDHLPALERTLLRVCTLGCFFISNCVNWWRLCTSTVHQQGSFEAVAYVGFMTIHQSRCWRIWSDRVVSSIFLWIWIIQGIRILVVEFRYYWYIFLENLILFC
jgi:hypothetical protein